MSELQTETAVAVKPLEWERSVMPPFVISSRCAVGYYRVRRGEVLGSGWWWWLNGNMGDEGHADEEDAQAAAQADYEQRIRSALVVPPVAPTHPLAAFPDGIAPGLYIVHWKSGGSSKAAIGMLPSGERWIAPTNWVRPSTIPSAGEWDDIDHAEPVCAETTPTSPSPHKP